MRTARDDAHRHDPILKSWPGLVGIHQRWPRRALRVRVVCSIDEMNGR